MIQLKSKSLIRQVDCINAISQALAIVSEYQLTKQELFRGSYSAQGARVISKVAANYRVTETGKYRGGQPYA